MNLYEFLLIALAMLIAVGVYFLERRERREILNRFMAKDYKEYNYYDAKFKKDIKEEEEINIEARKEREDFREDIKKDKDLITSDQFEDIENEEVEE